MTGFLTTRQLKNVLFLDIETVSYHFKFNDLSDVDKANWSKKAQQLKRDTSLTNKEISTLYAQKAGIFAEFSSVICISVGFFTINKKGIENLRVRSFYGENEKSILKSFRKLLNEYFNKPKQNFLCGHNLREFDIPFLCRRMLINGMELPDLLKISGKKPWQINHLLDILDLWRFGDYKHYISLSLLASVFNIPSPKGDMDGSMIHDVFWKEKDFKRIVHYCEKDVGTVAQLLLRLNGMHKVGEYEVISKTRF